LGPSVKPTYLLTYLVVKADENAFLTYFTSSFYTPYRKLIYDHFSQRITHLNVFYFIDILKPILLSLCLLLARYAFRKAVCEWFNILSAKHQGVHHVYSLYVTVRRKIPGRKLQKTGFCRKYHVLATRCMMPINAEILIC